MSDRITPRTAIKGFLDAASISQSATVATRSRVRRSSIPSISNTSRVEPEKRKSQSFIDITPRTLIQGVLATNEVAPDTARKRPRTTPPTKKILKALTPGTVTRSAIRRATRSDVLATPGGSNPTPRSLIQGLVNTAPVETPWNASAVRRRSSPRNKPDFPTILETLQSQAQGPSLSPFIKDAKSVPRLGGRKLRAGLRRGGNIDREAFAAGVADKLSQDVAQVPSTSRNISVLESFREEDEEADDSSLSDAEEEEEEQEKGEERDGDEDRYSDPGTEQVDEEMQEDDLNQEDDDDEQQVVGKDGLQDAEEELADPVFVPVSVEDPDGINQSERSMRRDQSTDEEEEEEKEEDIADQTTLGAEQMSLDMSAGGDASARGSLDAGRHTRTEDNINPALEDPSTGEDAGGETSTDDEALMPTQAAPSSLRRHGFSASRRSMGMKTMYLNDGSDASMVQMTLDGYSPLVTPKVAAGRSHKTPAPKRTPASRRSSVVPSPVAQAKKSAPKKTQKQQKPELNTLPASLTKSIFAHFSKAKVSKDALQAAMQGSQTFFKRVSDDLMTYASHAHRQTIEASDVELLMKRQHQITDKESLHSLIEKYLSGEYRQELIPIAKAGNKVTPKMGTT